MPQGIELVSEWARTGGLSQRHTGDPIKRGRAKGGSGVPPSVVSGIDSKPEPPGVRTVLGETPADRGATCKLLTTSEPYLAAC